MTEVAVAIVTLAGVLFTAIVTVKTSRHASAINDAVNHRHGEEPRLLDHIRRIATEVSEIRAWKDRWVGLPPELSTDGGLVGKLAHMDHKIDRTAAHIAQVHADLREHVDWEMAKYDRLVARPPKEE
jgi:hypothetical protein